MGTGFKIRINNNKEFSNMSAYNLGIDDIKQSNETADGSIFSTFIATRATLEVGWGMLKNSELQAIMASINPNGRNKIRYYDYSAQDGAGAYVENDFYLEGRQASIYQIDEKNDICWSEFSLKFVQCRKG